MCEYAKDALLIDPPKGDNVDDDSERGGGKVFLRRWLMITLIDINLANSP